MSVIIIHPAFVLWKRLANVLSFLRRVPLGERDLILPSLLACTSFWPLGLHGRMYRTSALSLPPRVYLILTAGPTEGMCRISARLSLSLFPPLSLSDRCASFYVDVIEYWYREESLTALIQPRPDYRCSMYLCIYLCNILNFSRDCVSIFKRIAKK